MGSTDPLVSEINTGKQHIHCELRRAYIGNGDCPVILPVGDIMVTGYVLYDLYPTNKHPSKITLNRQGDKLVANLPHQPPSGKLEYRIFLERAGTAIKVNEDKPVIVRFLGKVPVYILILQSIIVLLTLLINTYTGILAGIGINLYKQLTFLMVIILIGLVFFIQPIVHKYSLNQWWTCIPQSWELGNNKILVALIVWLITLYFNLKKARPGLVLISSLISIFLFLIPHGFPGLVYEPITIEVFLRKLIPLLQLF